MIYTEKGTKPGTLVCIHGNSSSAKVFQKLLVSKEIPYTKITVDLMGHGKNQNNDYTLSEFSVESYLNYLLETLSEIDGDILLLGNSLGGHLAIEIAPKVKNLKALVILGTPPVKKPINFEEAFLPVPALNTFLAENPSESDIENAFEVALKNKDKAQMIKDFKNANPLVRKATAEDIMGNKLMDEYEIFTSLEVPKYILSGDSDASVNRNYLKTVNKACQGSCKLINIEDCGHFPSVDRPQEFIQIIKNIANTVF